MQPFLRRIVDHRSGDSLAHRFRQKRFDFFKECISGFSLPMTILDLGGEQVYWERMGLAGVEEFQITILNLQFPSVTYSNLLAAKGDAANLAGFQDKGFDLVFSNSVIEHLGSYAAQQAMAREVRRVGKSYFIQTPNRYFPLEPHFLLPFFQFYPNWLRIGLVRRFNLGWYKKISEAEQAQQLIASHRLLSEGELRDLFPDGTVYKETLLGLTKSLTIYQIMAG